MNLHSKGKRDDNYNKVKKLFKKLNSKNNAIEPRKFIIDLIKIIDDSWTNLYVKVKR